MSKQIESLKQQLNDGLNNFQALRQQLKKMAESRNKLEVQLNENKIVKEELDLLEDGAKTFKLIGPAMVRVELKEAKNDVNTRMNYIQAEIKRQEKSIEQLNEQQKKHRDTIVELEQKLLKLQSS